MMRFRLIGLSQKGKNRVRENGEVWVQTHTTSPLRANEVLLKAEKTGNMRWVRKNNDPDFELEIMR